MVVILFNIECVLQLGKTCMTDQKIGNKQPPKTIKVLSNIMKYWLQTYKSGILHKNRRRRCASTQNPTLEPSMVGVRACDRIDTSINSR